MADHPGISPGELAALRDVALVDALEQIDPASLDGRLDLNAVVASIDPSALGTHDFRRLLASVGRIADSVPSLDLGEVNVEEFVRLIAATSSDQLNAALEVPELRAVLLDEIFRRMGSHVRAEKVKGLQAVIRWRLTGGTGTGGYDRYESIISKGTCTINREMSQRPRVTITVSPADFVRLITQQATPAVLFVTGKLRVKGDLGFAAGLIGYFDLPTA